MPTFPHAILGPMHVHPGVVSPQTYHRRQRKHLVSGRATYPGLVWPDPWRPIVRPVAFVSEGQWKAACVSPACRASADHPSLSIEWRLAICLSCGAVYEDVPIPEDAAEIVRVLLQRPDPRTRNWNWPVLDGSETVNVLRAQNRAAGDPD